MSVVWTAHPFKRALASAVAARAAIIALTPTVKVITYFPGADEPFADTIIVGYDLRDTVEKVTLGGQTHEEDVDVLCEIRVIRPGGGQTVATAVEDRAALILAEVDKEIRTGSLAVAGAQLINPGITARESILSSWQGQDGVMAKLCLIDFTVRYRAKTAP